MVSGDKHVKGPPAYRRQSWDSGPEHNRLICSLLADFSTLKKDAIRSSEMSVHTSSTRRHIPEDGILHSHRRENLKSYTAQIKTRKTLFRM
jgi:hypothetical protein